jgi:hypothetical protein
MKLWISTILLLASFTLGTAIESRREVQAKETPSDKTTGVDVETLGEHISPETSKKTRVFRRVGAAPIVYFSGMTIDADGAPDAYHPEDKGTDSLDHAGDRCSWWALALDDNKKPIVQNSGDFKGYYVSTTWLSREDDRYPESSPKYWVDARTVPYIAVPKSVFSATGVDKGDLAYVFNEKTGKSSFAIVADWGTENTLGEGSIALGKELGINSDPRTGGQDDGVAYVVFPGSASQPAWPRENSEMKAQAMRLVANWGGQKALSKLRSVALGPILQNQVAQRFPAEVEKKPGCS